MLCDYCNKEITKENEGSFFMTIRCSNSEEDWIQGEYSSNGFAKMGNMCGTCATKILKKIEKEIENIGLPERYDSDFDKEKLKKILIPEQN